IFHAFTFLIGEDDLAFLHGVTFTDFHGRLHADIVTAKNGHRTDRGPLPDVLARFACDGKIKSPLDFDHSCSPIERFWILGTGKASSFLPGALLSCSRHKPVSTHRRPLCRRAPL